MFPRLLPLLCLLFLSQAAFTQQGSATAQPEAVPESCAVTKAYDNPFVPPYPYHPKTMSGDPWFGTDRLWIDPPVTMKGHRQKMEWWRQGYDWFVDGDPKLKVTGRRLDSPAPPLVAVAHPVGLRAPTAHMMVGMTFPTVGCWEITGRYEDEELTFVVWVAE